MEPIYLVRRVDDRSGGSRYNVSLDGTQIGYVRNIVRDSVYLYKEICLPTMGERKYETLPTTNAGAIRFRVHGISVSCSRVGVEALVVLYEDIMHGD